MVQLLARTPASLFGPRNRPAIAEEGPSLDRQRLLARIMELNTTATEEYLSTFGDHALGRYLSHLESAGQPRGGRWERVAETPAIVVRETEV